MMPFAFTDAELILLLLGAIYLIECVVWVPHEAICFGSWLAGRFRWFWFGTLFRTERGGLIVGSLFPLGRTMVCQAWPISMSPLGMCSYVSQSINPHGRSRQIERFVHWDEVQSVRSIARAVHVNDMLFVEVCSPRFARYLVATIENIVATPSSQREICIINLLEQAMDVNQISARLAHFCDRTRFLSWICIGLFFLTFVLAPMYLSSNAVVCHYRPNQYVFLGCYIAVWGLAVVCAYRAHLVLFPGDHNERREYILMAIASPAGAMRAIDLLSQPLLASYHPIAVASVVLPRIVFQKIARRALLDIRYPMLPICSCDDENVIETEKWYSNCLRKALEQMVEQLGIQVECLLAPPESESIDSRSYCPRCDGQYRVTEGHCEDCGGRSLVPFEMNVPSPT